MRGRAAAASLAGMFALTQPAANYVDVLQQYLTGDADAAVDRMETFAISTIDDGARALVHQKSSRLLYAAAAIHTEVALRPQIEISILSVHHFNIAKDIVQYGELHAKRRRNGISFSGSGLPPLRPSFRRLWYLAVIRHHEGWGRFAIVEPLLERARELYPLDAEVLLVDAIADEALSTARYGDESAGRRAGHLREAERKLEASLAADPNAPEARLRHAFVLYALGRADAARQALFGLPSSPDARVGYLSLLLLGRIADETGDTRSAEQDYTRALKFQPGSQSAVIALSELRNRLGDRAGAVQILPAALESSGTIDPWWTYPLGQLWMVGSTRMELRAMARAQ